MEEVEDDKTAIKCEALSPASLRSLRLDWLHTGALHAASPEDVRTSMNLQNNTLSVRWICI